MHLFYTENIENGTACLSDTESRHCLKALRLRTGDEIQLTDGRGFLYTAVIADDNGKSCLLSIRKTEQMPEAFPFHLHIAVAPTKNQDRLEWFVEKAVEIGISEISCTLCAHSERKSVKEERFRRLMISAMKQSLHYRLPLFHEQVGLTQLLQEQAGFPIQKFIAYCGEDEQSRPLQEVCLPGKDTLVLIGPEGDFSPEEVSEAKRCGFAPVSLGKSRLRTETAALVACATVHFVNQQERTSL